MVCGFPMARPATQQAGGRDNTRSALWCFFRQVDALNASGILEISFRRVRGLAVPHPSYSSVFSDSLNDYLRMPAIHLHVQSSFMLVDVLIFPIGIISTFLDNPVSKARQIPLVAGYLKCLSGLRVADRTDPIHHKSSPATVLSGVSQTVKSPTCSYAACESGVARRCISAIVADLA